MESPAAEDLRLGTGYRDILRLALPITLALLVPQLNFLTNNIFLAQLGEHELASAGLTGVYYLIFAVIGGGLANGLQMLMARKAGENQPRQIGVLFRNNTRIALALGVFGIVVTYTLGTFILERSIQDPATAERVTGFLRIRILGLPLLYLYAQRNALLVSMGKTKWLVLGTLAETVLNIALDYALIFGHWGAPEIGFNGAAIASVIAEGAGLAVIAAVVQASGIKEQIRRLTDGPKKEIRWKVIGLILVTSSPLIAQYALSIMTWEYFYLLIERYGARDLAISSTMRNIIGLAGIFFWAFASTANTMVSNIIGQKREQEVIGLTVRIMITSVISCLPLLFIINLEPGWFLNLYGLGAEFISAAIPITRIVSGSLVVASIGAIWLNAVTGTGNTRVNLLIEAFALVGYLIYVTLVLRVFQLGIAWGWASEVFYWLILLACGAGYMLSGRWKNKTREEISI